MNAAAAAATPLISVDGLQQALAGDSRPVVLDASFDLADPAAGARDHLAAHLPGAIYLHLENDLSGPRQTADGRFRGRHPLPDIDDFAAVVGHCGIGPSTPVVVYDRQGAMMAARVWWMLRWLGHEQVAVLDGGMAAWQAAGGAVEAGSQPHQQLPPYPHRGPAMPTIDAHTLLARLGRIPLIDARAPERYRGEVEPLDAAAGHIPGAANRFFKDNLGADGRFKPAAQLAAAFSPLLGGGSAQGAVHQCGSGVTACHNMLAMAIAGFADSTLYPGSWSEWSSDPARPIEKS